MQTIILCLNNEGELQEEVNLSLRQLIKSGNSIIDIKFSTSAYPWGDTTHYEPAFSAMILYKEEN